MNDKTHRDDPRTMRLVHHATRIFIERSYDTATVEEIASAAGMGKASVYRLIGDKTDLLNAVMQHATRHMIQACSMPLDPARRAHDMLCAFAESYIAAMYRPFAGGLPYYHVARVMISLGFQRPDVMQDFIAAYQAAGVEPLAAYLAARAAAGELSSIDPRDAVTFFQLVFYTDQALAYHEDTPAPAAIAEAARYRVGLFLHGCAREGHDK